MTKKMKKITSKDYIKIDQEGIKSVMMLGQRAWAQEKREALKIQKERWM